jgi:hypothetical protein
MKVKPTTIPKRDSHDPRWNELGEYARDLADRMGLGQWHFILSHDPPDDKEADAAVEICKQAVDFSLHIGDAFWTSTPYGQRWTLVHEMVHVIEAPFMKALQEILDSVVPASTGAIINQLSERFVDQLAIMLAPRYSLPPKGFKKKAVAKPKNKVGHVPHNVSRKHGEADL